jgi:hypothetical protein
VPKDTIYHYVDGSHLEGAEAELTAAFAELVRGWENQSLMLVNDRRASNSTAILEIYPTGCWD